MQTKRENNLLPSDLWYFLFGLGLLNKLDLKYLSMTCNFFYELIELIIDNEANKSLIKNAPWPLSDYSQHISKGDCLFFKALTEIVSFIQLKNGNFVCGLSSGQIHILDGNSAKWIGSLDAHIKPIWNDIWTKMRSIKNAASTADELKELSSLALHFPYSFRTNTSGYTQLSLPIRVIYEHSNGDIITGGDKKIGIFDAKTGYCKKMLVGHTGAIVSIKELANGNILTGSHRGDIRIWDVVSGECLQTLKNIDKGISSMQVLSNGNILSGGLDGSLFISHIERDEQKLVGTCHNAIRSMILFDDKNVVTASDDKILRVWDSQTWTCKKILCGHEGAIKVLAKLGEQYIVSGSDDKTIRIWHIKTGYCINILEAHTDSITALLVKENGDIASISDDFTFKTWHFGYMDARQDASQAMISANNMRL